MNTYKYDDLTIGMTESFQVKITLEMMKKFLEITGDNNPLHCDASFAAQRGHHNRVVYGMLTASFLSTLAGVYLPGENSLIQAVETSFVKPVYIGDELTVVGTAVELSNTIVDRLVLKITITNQNNEKVLRGRMTIGVLNG